MSETNGKQALWNRLGQLLGVTNAAPAGPTVPVPPAQPSAPAGGKSPQPAAPQSPAVPSAPDYSNNPQTTRDPGDADPHIEAAGKAGMSVKEYKEHLSGGGKPADVTKNANPEGHNQYTGVGTKKQHAALAEHGYTHEGLRDEGSGQMRHLASHFVKKVGSETHRVTIADRHAKTKEGKLVNIGTWRSEHNTPGDYKNAYGTGTTSLQEQLKKVHGTTTNAKHDRCPECGGKLDEDGDCEVCDYVENEPMGPGSTIPSSATPPPRPAQSLNPSQTRGMIAGIQQQESGRVSMPQATITNCRVCDGPVTNGRCGDCYAENGDQSLLLTNVELGTYNEFASDEQREAFFGLMKQHGGDSGKAVDASHAAGKADAEVKSAAADKRSGIAKKVNKDRQAKEHGKAAAAHEEAGKAHEAAGNKDLAAAHFKAAKEHQAKAGLVANALHDLRHGDTGRFRPVGSGTGRGPTHAAAVSGSVHDSPSNTGSDDAEARTVGRQVMPDGRTLAKVGPGPTGRKEGLAGQDDALSYDFDDDSAAALEEDDQDMRGEGGSKVKINKGQGGKNIAHNQQVSHMEPATAIQQSAPDPHEASKTAAKASLDAEHDKAFGHARDAVMASGDDDCDGAAKSHIKAAAQHERAATQARKGGDQSEADQHDQAAFLHRKAASMHAAGMTNNEQRVAVMNWLKEHSPTERRTKTRLTENSNPEGHNQYTGAAGSKGEKLHQHLEKNGFHETGGGDDFASYGHKGDKSQNGGPRHNVYIKDDGSWEHHDFQKQSSDDPSQAQASGKGLASLKAHMDKAGLVNNHKPTTNKNERANATPDERYTFGGTVMPRISREQALATLTANCDNDQDRVALNSLSNELLAKMAMNATDDDDDDEDDEDEQDMENNEGEEVHSFDTPQAKGKQIQAGGKGTKDEYLKNAPTGNMRQWLAAMPPQAQEIWNSVHQTWKQARYNQVNDLVQYVSDPKARNLIGNKLMNNQPLTVPEQLLLTRSNRGAAVANQDQQTEVVPNFMGAGEFRLVGNADEGGTDGEVLDIPAMNQADWKEWANDPMGTGKQRTG